MKKITAALLLLCLVAAFSGCAGGDGGDTDTADDSTIEILNPVTNQTVTTLPPTQPTSAPTTSPTTLPTTSPTVVKNRGFEPVQVTGAPDAAAGTFTGYKALAPVSFAVEDPDNTRELSTKRIDHSFGVPKNGQPNQISIDSQKYFDSKKLNAVTYDNKSTEKVLYLTFDCGYENGYTSKVLDTLKEKNVSAAFFCTLDHIKAEPELIARMIHEGHIVGNHSDKHPNFSKINRTRMAAEIESCDNYLRENFGYSSPYFRFPEGAYSESALDLVQSLGFKSVFWSLAYSDWDTSAQKGSQYAFDTVTARLHPGAIILLHSVSADNSLALGDIIDYAREQGYEFRSLTELPD